MRFHKVFIFFLLIKLSLLTCNVNAQYITVSGQLLDVEDSSYVIGAVVYLKSHPSIGTVTNEKGEFFLKCPIPNEIIVIKNIGYPTTEIHLAILRKNPVVHIQSIARTEVTIEGNAYRKSLESTQMSTTTLTTKDAKLLPAFLGEIDLLKTLQLKPGIQSGGEGNSGVYVRGGGPDQNLFLLNNIVVYNPNHLFGFFSVFNADAVKDITLYKGGFPAQYGGRLSSVIDIHTNNGDPNKHEVNGGIGLISSRLSVSGPIVKNKLWGNVSFRRTYADIFTKLINAKMVDNADYDPIPDYAFYDGNLQLSYQVNPKNIIHFTGYLGRDNFNFKNKSNKFKFNWGNTLAGITWVKTIDSTASLNTTASLSDYKYTLQNQLPSFNFNLTSGIRDYAFSSQLKKEFKKHTITTGIQINNYIFNISRLQAGSTDGQVSFSSGTKLYATGGGVFLNDVFKIKSRWTINTGLRWSWFYRDKFYQGLEPRLQVNYRLKETFRIKASYSRMFQYIQLASNSGASLPTDIWYPSGKIPAPQLSDQIALGYEITLLKNKLFFSNEYYYKKTKNLLDFKDGAQLFVNDSLEREFIFGKGESYGTEFYLEKKQGKTTGWIGYTLSWSNRKFTEVNNGNWFPARYDRRHDISIVAVHKLSQRFSTSGTFVYGTGQAISLPIGRFFIQDAEGGRPAVVPVYTERNTFRLPAYHRMDVALIYHFKPKWGQADLTLSVYNVYNRRNTYFIYFEEVKDKNGLPIKYIAKQVSLFPILPALTFNFKW